MGKKLQYFNYTFCGIMGFKMRLIFLNIQHIEQFVSFFNIHTVTWGYLPKYFLFPEILLTYVLFRDLGCCFWSFNMHCINVARTRFKGIREEPSSLRNGK